MYAVSSRKPFRAVVSVLFVPLVVLASSVAAPPALGAPPASKIGYVDIDRIAQDSTFIRRMMSDLEKTLDAKRDQVERKQGDYSVLRGDIERKRAVVSENDLEEMIARSRRLRIEIDEESAELNRILQRAEKERMKPALDRILEIIRSVGKEEGFDLIVHGEFVLYGAPSVDITDKVIKRLDREAAADASSAAQRPAAKATATPPPKPPVARVPSVAGDDGAAPGRK